ncbi:MAG: aminoglycoside phosphotransferase family protein [Endozoicomonas sp.]
MIPSERKRQTELAAWAQQILAPDLGTPSPSPQLTPVGGDAGFRHYYRIQVPEGTVLAVDAPPATEDNRAFVDVDGLFASGGVRVPSIRAVDFDAGFMLIEDFGDTLLLSQLNSRSTDFLYGKALDVLKRVQASDASSLPPYDTDLLQTELMIFREWFIGRLLELELSGEDERLLSGVCERLICSALEQPTGVVHRDYHSRNLMLLPGDELGVIDFQGAVRGPLLYDLVSLLKDCYVVWPRENVENWLRGFIAEHSKLEAYDLDTCLRWFDWIGLQRHLKCLGIFSRLWLRDGKSQYLTDIPATFNYVMDVCDRYPELKPLGDWLGTRVATLMPERMSQVREEAGL